MFRGSEVRRFANILATKMQQKKRPSSVFLFYHPNLPRANQGLSPLPAMLPIARNYPLLSSKFVWLMDFMDFMDFRHGFQHISRYYMSTYFNLFQPISTYFNLFQPISTIQTYFFPMDFHHVPPWPTSGASRCARPLGSCGLKVPVPPTFVASWSVATATTTHKPLIYLYIYIYIYYIIYLYIYVILCIYIFLCTTNYYYI